MQFQNFDANVGVLEVRDVRDVRESEAGDSRRTVDSKAYNNGSESNVNRYSNREANAISSLSANSIHAERFIPQKKLMQWDQLPSMLMVPVLTPQNDVTLNPNSRTPPKHNKKGPQKLHHWIHDPVMRRSNFDLSTFNLLNHITDGVVYMQKCMYQHDAALFPQELLNQYCYANGTLGMAYQTILQNRNIVKKIEHEMTFFCDQKMEENEQNDPFDGTNYAGNYTHPSRNVIRKNYRLQQLQQQQRGSQLYVEKRVYQTTPETLAIFCDEIQSNVENNNTGFGLESAMALNGSLRTACRDYLTKITMLMDIERLQALEDLKAYDMYSCRFESIGIPPPLFPARKCPACGKNKMKQPKNAIYCPHHANILFSNSPSSSTLGRIVTTKRQFDNLHYILVNIGSTKGQRVIAYLNVPGVAENRPLICMGDPVRFRFGNTEIIGEVGEVQVKTETIMLFLPVPIELGMCPEFVNALKNPKNQTYRKYDDINFGRFDVRFGLFSARAHDIFKRVANAAMLHSVDQVIRVMAPTPFLERIQKKSSRRPQIGISDWANTLNTEQKHAVFDILRNNHGQAPYCIYGPPGTGKTMTVVESIFQILRHDKNSKILVCAPSDAACDVITKRLLLVLPAEATIKRVNWWSRNSSSLPPELLGCSSMNESGFFVLPPQEEIKNASVIVCQCFVAGCLDLEFTMKKSWMSRHFTHTFIDESSQSFEFESLIPLIKVGQKCSIVLAGDPRQLGPTVRNRCASRNGLSLSLQERLMGLSLYQMDSNYCVITKLLDNYRSHNALLQVPSELFYSGSLRCRASTELTSSCEKFELLNDGHNFPMMVYDVDDGIEKNKVDTPSFYNLEECHTIVKLIKALLASPNVEINAGQIAVITCFRAQVLKMREILRDSALGSINVGVVEDFQGQETSVVLISTVLTKDQDRWRKGAKSGLGFMTDPKRFNVAITRASALCVIVGKVDYLESSGSYWTALIEHVRRNGGVSGDSKFITNDPDDSEEYSEHDYGIDEFIDRVKELNLALGSGHEMDRYDLTMRGYYQDAPEWRVCL